MKCPSCAKDMVEQDFGGAKVDICKNGCKGIWFDWGEIFQLDEKNEGFGAALKDALDHPQKRDTKRGKIKCPKCNIPMHEHKYRSSKQVDVDECYQCGGFFLDSGELATIRKTFMTKEELDEYAEKLIADMPEYKNAKRNLARERLRTRAINKYTRFIRASYYAGKIKKKFSKNDSAFR